MQSTTIELPPPIVINLIQDSFINNLKRVGIYENKISLYPNPANHETILTIDQVDESTTLNAFDATGKRIQLDFEKTYVNGVVVFKINTQNLVNGVYILETRNTNFTSSNRLIIQK